MLRFRESGSFASNATLLNVRETTLTLLRSEPEQRLYVSLRCEVTVTSRNSSHHTAPPRSTTSDQSDSSSPAVDGGGWRSDLPSGRRPSEAEGGAAS
ncbi:unnamed protein product [Boreogadus saida]